MLINQIAVFSENKEGKLLPIVKTLGDSGINIDSLNIADTEQYGVVRMLTSDNPRAKKVLDEAGYITRLTDLVAIEVDDKAGRLSSSLEALSKGGVNIEYMYSYSLANGKALILFKTEEIELAQKILG